MDFELTIALIIIRQHASNVCPICCLQSTELAGQSELAPLARA